jgi:hypothetical protein
VKTVFWKIHLKSSPGEVFKLLSTRRGRESFWAESAEEIEGIIHFIFPNGESYESQIIKSIENQEFQVDYFNSKVTFKLKRVENDQTDLSLINEGIQDEEYDEILAGWVSVLLNLKATADFNSDLRNHNPMRTWNEGYVDN